MRSNFRTMTLAWLGWLGVFGLLLAGCHGRSNRERGGDDKSYLLHGTIVTVDPTGQSVMVSGEEIPGFMEAMTMSYRLEDPSVASELHPGDKIAATLVVTSRNGETSSMKLREIVITAQAKPDYKPKVTYHLPQKGDLVPDFHLRNQSDHTIDIDQFRGKVLLITFIYTRCPLADYCPKMSRNFAALDQALSADPATRAETHLLSVSFDPDYDTPAVLKSYGEAYTGRFVKERFEHWDFAAPQGEELHRMELWFSVGVTPGESGTLQHSLSTAVVGKDGRIVAFYPTNDWTVEQVLRAVHAAV